MSNPLCGPHGAAYVFGPQKGAKPKDLPLLDEALRRFSQVVKQDLGKDILDTPGSGAAGGMGAGLMAFFDAQLVPGFQIVNEGVGFEALLQKLRPDVVITGEGRMDAQSVMGKLPVEVRMMSYRISSSPFIDEKTSSITDLNSGYGRRNAILIMLGIIEEIPKIIMLSFQPGPPMKKKLKILMDF